MTPEASHCIQPVLSLWSRQPHHVSDHSSPAPTLKTLIQSPSIGATVQVPLPSPRLGVLLSSGSRGFPFLRFEFNRLSQIILLGFFFLHFCV